MLETIHMTEPHIIHIKLKHLLVSYYEYGTFCHNILVKDFPKPDTLTNGILILTLW